MSDSLQVHGLVPLSMEFFSQEYCSVLSHSSLEDLPNLMIKPGALALQADSLPSEPPEKPINTHD